jgi:hypothetical protein
MATTTLERVTEVVEDKTVAAASVEDVARAEDKDRVEGSGATETSRAWSAKAQID